jgi:sugar lactone lactonase YvrE
MRSKAFAVIGIVLALTLAAGCKKHHSSTASNAPTGVSAESGDGQAIISWTTSTDVLSYNLYWSATSGVTKANGTKIENAVSPCTVTGLTNKTTYYFIVTGVFSSGEGDASAEVSVTPNVPAPGAVTATAGIGQNTIVWDAVAGADSYNLYWSTTSGVTSSITSTITGISNVTSPYVHTGLTNGTTYYYVVTEVRGGLESSPSAELRATPQITATNAVIDTLAGTGSLGYSGDLGPAVSAQLYWPIGVAVDSLGNVYIADVNNNRVRKVNTTGIITTMAGTGTAGYSGDGRDAAQAELNAPYGLAVDASDNLYIADYGNKAIRKVVLSGMTGTITTIATGLVHPTGVAVSASGTVYVADPGSNSVLLIASGVTTTVAGTGTAGFSGDGGDATLAQLNSPFGVAVDASGNLYIADYGNSVIRKVDGARTISTIAGIGTAGYSGDSAAANTAELNGPFGVAVDAAGNLFIADFYNNLIRKVDTAGYITTVAGNGPAGFTGDGGVATSAKLRRPTGVAVDASGSLFIADYGNDRVRKVQ